MSRFLHAAALSALLAGPAAAFDIDAMSDSEREAFRGEVRAYLLENPEVLMEAISVLEQRDAEAQSASDAQLVSRNSDALFDDGHSWVGGNPDGDVTVVEFLDYKCGYCKRAHPEVTELIESDGNIRLIVKEFPILGEQSVEAASFAVAVLRTEGGEAYETVNDRLMAMRSDITENSLRRLSDELGLDTDTVMTEMEDPEVRSLLAENRQLGQTLQINGTPTFVFGDQLVRGYVPLDAMRDIVAEEREG
ncbi:Protein-disulfide isomerase [Tranquillimonas rosea]|uniref:Protein-disulfide isomerase n=1 Tax=Tranquillimonas rosea TaxID=641238 RepID=A0A1H9PRR3_9RHOB|nr:DsbA family protein [Tranquillimonas rosea]SER50917.1 Protein-disulfide isomerase [Tranquillimonas rosea]